MGAIVMFLIVFVPFAIIGLVVDYIKKSGKK